MAGIISFYTLAVGALLYVSYSHKYFKYYTVLKAFAGLGFVSLGVFCSEWDVFSCLMLCAFAACLLGDVFLGLANNKQKYFGKLFICGLCSFALAHIIFSGAFSLIAPLSLFDFGICAISFGVTFIIANKKSFRFAKMKIPALCYSVFVGLACARGLNAGFMLFNYKGLLMALGAVFFLISDCLILFLYFPVKKPRKIVRVLNLLTYYIAMLFLALSL